MHDLLTAQANTLSVKPENRMATNTADNQELQVPDGWDAQACLLWSQGQQLDAVHATIQRLNSDAAKDRRMSLQLAYYLFLLKDYRSAAAVLEDQARRHPDDLDIVQNLTVLYLNTGRLEKALACAQATLRLKPDHAGAYDSLARCLHELGRDAEAAAAGAQALTLKENACTLFRDEADWHLPQGDARVFARLGNKRDTIAFSLWGDHPRYLRGALRNVLLAPDLYPGWVCRFYVDASVPPEFIRLIERLGGEIVPQSAGQTLRKKLCWRFQVADDPTVGHFLVRDADSVFSVRELLAVSAWLASGAWFHCMRDWWTHTDPVLAGMWGGVAGVLPPLHRLLATYQPSLAETPNVDQWFLRERVWRYMRQSCLIHDRCFRSPGAVPFPGPIPDGNFHVGQNEFSARPGLQERLLQAWIESHPCLGAIGWGRHK